MSSALVQQATASSAASTTLTLTLGAAPSAGSVVVVSVQAGGTTSLLCNTPSMTGVTNWTRLGSSNSGATSHAEIWIGDVGASAGTVCTVTHSVAHTFRGNISEWTGLTQTSATGSGFFNTPASTTEVTASITPTSSVAAVLFACATNTTGSLSTPTNSFTALNTANASQAQSYRQIASTSGSYSTGWTNSINSVAETVIAVVYETVSGGTFKSAFARNSNSYLGPGT